MILNFEVEIFLAKHIGELERHAFGLSVIAVAQMHGNLAVQTGGGADQTVGMSAK